MSAEEQTSFPGDNGWNDGAQTIEYLSNQTIKSLQNKITALSIHWAPRKLVSVSLSEPLSPCTYFMKDVEEGWKRMNCMQ